MTILLIIGAVLAGLWLLNALLGAVERWHQPKHAFDRETLARLLQTLLNQGHDGWLLFVERKPGAEFLQFRKYVRGAGHPGIEFAFPDSDWSRGYVDPLRALLEEQGVKYVVVPTGSEPVTAFVLVDFGKDVTHAGETALTIVGRVFALPEAEFRCHFEGSYDPRPSARIGF